MVQGAVDGAEPIVRLVATWLFTAALLCGAVPDPAAHFGHAIGVDRVLLDWNKVVSYFQALGKADGGVRVAEIGRSVQGRPLIAAIISAEPNMAKLTTYQQMQYQKLKQHLQPYLKVMWQRVWCNFQLIPRYDQLVF